ncbi:hypothetical protein RFI_34986, partial [Reticulomyxa filosa]
TERGTQEYTEKVVNVTIMVYDPRQFFDFELLFMFILIVAFWGAVAWAVYALYYVPTQQAKGKNPMTTTEIFEKSVNKIKSVMSVSDNSDASTHDTTANGESKKTKQELDDDWLVGTALGKVPCGVDKIIYFFFFFEQMVFIDIMFSSVYFIDRF